MEEGLEGVLELCVEFLAAEIFFRFLVLLAGLFLGIRFASEGPSGLLAAVYRGSPRELVFEGLVD